MNEKIQKILQDIRITPDALGVYWYILSNGSTGSFSYHRIMLLDSLISHFKHYSKYDIERACLELEKYHYLSTKRLNNYDYQLIITTINDHQSDHYIPHHAYQSHPFTITKSNDDKINNYNESKHNSIITKLIVANRKWIHLQSQSSNFNQIYLNYALGFHVMPPRTQHDSDYCIKWINKWLQSYSITYINKEINKIITSNHTKAINLTHPLGYLGHSLHNDYKQKHTLNQYSSSPIQHSTKIGRIFANFIHKHEQA